MTNAVATIGLTYRGTDVQEAFGNGSAMFLELVRGYNEPADVRGDDLIVPGKVGRFQGTRIKDVRRVVLEGVVMGAIASPASSFRAKVATFSALFDPTVSGSLVATLEDASTKTLTNCRTRSVVWDKITEAYARVNVELESTTPDWA